MSSLQSKCKDIVSFFHCSTKASDKLRSVQDQLSLPQLKLIQDVATRWNSTYIMMERISSQHEAVTTTLCLVDKSNMCLTTEEKDTIITSLKLLEPFLQATEDISGDKYVSISMIIPLAGKFLMFMLLLLNHYTASSNGWPTVSNLPVISNGVSSTFCIHLAKLQCIITCSHSHIILYCQGILPLFALPW